MDRALVFWSGGCRFESCHQQKNSFFLLICNQSSFFFALELLWLKGIDWDYFFFKVVNYNLKWCHSQVWHLLLNILYLIQEPSVFPSVSEFWVNQIWRTRTDPDGPGRTRTDPDGPRPLSHLVPDLPTPCTSTPRVNPNQRSIKIPLWWSIP